MTALVRLTLLLWALASAVFLALTLHRIANDATLTPWREAALDEIAASTDRMLARAATPQALAQRTQTLLAESPRNWLALDALRALADERGIALPAPLLTQFDTLKAQDSGLLAQTGACLTCAWDAASCSLSQVFLCQAPVNLTPVGDVLGLGRGLTDYALGDPVDALDLSLSAIGLGATLLALPSGGSSATVKAGAGLLKTAAKMGRLSRPLRDMFETALKQGIRWDRLASTDWLTDPARLIRAEAFGPATRTVVALDDIRSATDMTTVLHVLPLVNRAEDATGLARVARAGGKSLVAKVEILGKARLLRAGIRLSRVGAELLGGFLALASGLASLAGHLVTARLRVGLRRLAKVR